MRKPFRTSIIALICIFMSVSSASATLKIDISKNVGKVTTTVSGWLETAKKQMEQSATLQTMIAMGKGAVETAKKLKEVQGAINTAASDVQSLAEESAGVVGDAVSGAQDAVGSAMGDTLSKTEDAQELLELNAQKMALEAQRDDEIAAAQAELNGKISLAEENIAKLQNMISWEPNNKLDYESQIAYYEGEINNYKKELDSVSDTITSKYQSQIAAVESKILALREEALAKAGDAAAKKLSSFLNNGDEEVSAAMNEMIKNNFLAENDDLTVENITPRKIYRKVNALNDTVAAFNNTWRVKKTRYDNNETASEVQENVPQMEGSSASLGMDIQLKVENINAVLEYTRMMVNDLKMRTANELNNLSNNWKLTRYDKDVTEFNLDDYIFDGKSKAEKLLDLAKDIKDKGVKGAAEDMLNDAADNNDSEAEEATNDPLEAVKEELRQARSKSGKYEGVDEAGVQDITPVNVDEELSRARSGAASE